MKLFLNDASRKHKVIEHSIGFACVADLSHFSLISKGRSCGLEILFDVTIYRCRI